MLKLILADNQAIFRAGIAKVLAVEDEMRIVAQAQTQEQMFMALDKFRAAVLVVAGGFHSDFNGILLAANKAKTRVVVLAGRALRHGRGQGLARDLGQVALDGNGDHSPFATALLNHLQTPNLEIGMFFRVVRDDVRYSTRRQQEPFVYGSLPGEDFYFTIK